MAKYTEDFDTEVYFDGEMVDARFSIQIENYRGDIGVLSATLTEWSEDGMTVIHDRAEAVSRYGEATVARIERIIWKEYEL